MAPVAADSAVLPVTNSSLPQDAPVVAVVVSLNTPGTSAEIAQLVDRFRSCALDELNAVGARIVLFDSSAAHLDDAHEVDKVDGVLFLGGGDVDPTLYGHHESVPNAYGVDRRADDYAMGIIRATIARDAPLLCICRGSQLLNVTLGGDLIPDIQPHELHRGSRGEPTFKDEAVSLTPGSKIHHIYGVDRLIVRSGHHQAVNTVAPRLVVTARADDGVVEGTELPEASWVVGIQWHPEDSDGSARDRRLLFSAFMDAVRASRTQSVDEAAAESGGEIVSSATT